MLHLPVGKEANLGNGVPRFERHCPEQTLLYQLVEKYYPVIEAQWAVEGRVLPNYVQHRTVSIGKHPYAQRNFDHPFHSMYICA